MSRLSEAHDDDAGSFTWHGIDRRTFLKRGLAAGAGVAGAGGVIGALASCGSSGEPMPGSLSDTAQRRTRSRPEAPNVLVVMVDQMRTPVWPATVPLTDAMPNLERIRADGVSFARHYTASNDCTPARSTLLTGLYTHQTGCMVTGGSTLDPGFPTWGSILREQGYATYWFGKWHLTHGDNRWQPADGHRVLESYGFAGGTFPSPDGAPGQGWHKDPRTASEFQRWIADAGHDEPWCTTVSFVNPHDIAWWYALSSRAPVEADPPPVSRALAPNFETPQQMIARNKPTLQRSLQDTAAASFGPVPFEGRAAVEVWLPFMDLYVRLLKRVDEQIGSVLDALQSRPDLAANTVILFTSDHGEYGSSHGLRGKGASAYEEALRVPLIVNDPRAQLTSAPTEQRTQLTSSVDVTPLLLTIASGSNAWRSERRYAHLARRADLAAILSDPTAPGRPYVMHATDEIVTEFAVQRFAADAPRHVIALRTPHAKVASYSFWPPSSIAIETAEQEHELYDYSNRAGRLEIDNVAGRDSLSTHMSALLAAGIEAELRRPLPPYLSAARERGFANYFLIARKAALHATAGRLRDRQGIPLSRPRRRASPRA